MHNLQLEYRNDWPAQASFENTVKLQDGVSFWCYTIVPMKNIDILKRLFFSQEHVFIPAIISQEYISGFSRFCVVVVVVILLGGEGGKGISSLKWEAEQQW